MALLIIDLKILGLNGKKKTEYMSVFLVKCQNEKYYYFRIIIKINFKPNIIFSCIETFSNRF